MMASDLGRNPDSKEVNRRIIDLSTSCSKKLSKYSSLGSSLSEQHESLSSSRGSGSECDLRCRECRCTGSLEGVSFAMILGGCFSVESGGVGIPPTKGFLVLFRDCLEPRLLMDELSCLECELFCGSR